MDLPRISFVIPTHARRDTLRDVLERLEGARYRRNFVIDVVVVDDASSDGTSEMLHRDFPRIKVHRNDAPQGFDGLGRGVDLTEGDLIFFLDDDAYPHPDTLDKVVDHFEQRGEVLGMTALPFIDADSGRTAYSPYLPTVPEGDRYAATHGFFAGAVVFRRAVLAATPPSPAGYFMYATEPPATLEVLARGWEADFLADAPVYHLFEARRAGVRPHQAILPFGNDLVTIRRYYRGLQRVEMLIGRYLTGFIHLLAAGTPWSIVRVHRDAWRRFNEAGERDVPASVRQQVYPCFEGATLRTLVSEATRRRIAYGLGRLPFDQVG